MINERRIQKARVMFKTSKSSALEPICLRYNGACERRTRRKSDSQERRQRYDFHEDHRIGTSSGFESAGDLHGTLIISTPSSMEALTSSR